MKLMRKQMMGRCVMRVLTLLVLVVLVRSAPDCPRPCSCPQPGEIHCTFRSLVTVPTGLPPDAERLNLGFNNINRITDSSFAGVQKLELLMMHGNNIHNIPDGVFHDLISLQMMKLSYNKLKVVSRNTFHGLWSLARLHLDHNHLEFIHPDAFQGLTSLRLLQLEGNRLQQLHPATFTTLSVLGHFHMSTIKHLYLSENGLTTLSQKMLAGMPHLENLFLHDNPWTCDCGMKWFKEWSSAAPGILKCKKDKAVAGGQLCPMCFSPRQLKETDIRELDNPKCTGPFISALNRNSELNTESEPLTLLDFQQSVGNVSLSLSDEHGNQVDLNCQVNEPTESTRKTWDSLTPNQIDANITLTLDLECPIDRAHYERLWRLIAYYSDVPAHLIREIMLSKEPHMSYRYRQDVEKDAVYYTGVKANIVAEPSWIMQSSLDLQLNRPQSTSKKVKLILSTHLSQQIDAESERLQKRSWVMIESRNTTRTLQAAVVGSPIQMHCNVHGSESPLIKWVLPNGTKVEAPYQSSDNRVTVSASGLLTITAVDHSDSGVYYCMAEVAGDVSILLFRLAVEDSSTPAPGSEDVAEPMAGVAGRPMSLPCVALGSPDPDINWILPDNSIINSWSNLSRMSVSSNGTLTIRYGQISDNGYYKCVAENQHGIDTMATKLTLTRPSGGQPMRKYASRPQPAEGVSTKIIPLTENGLEASGDNEKDESEDKALVGRVDTSNKRRIPNVAVQGGHPFRKVWRRPALPRRRVNPQGADRNKLVETRRRINVSNGQIDPERWANILAKVHNGGNAKTVTVPNSIQSNTNKLEQPETATSKQSGSQHNTTPQEGLHPVTASETSMQTTEDSLDIRPLNPEDNTHITYQIAAPEVDQDSGVFTYSTYAMQTTTTGPRATSHWVEDTEQWNEVSTVSSTTLSPELDTAVGFKGQTTKTYSGTHVFTDNTKTRAPERQTDPHIPLITTVAPRTRFSNRGTTNFAPPSRSRMSSNSRRRNGGRRKRPNRIRTKPNSSKSAHFPNITPQPTTFATVSLNTKITASTESEIATSTRGVSTVTKIDTTVPFTDSQETSRSEMSHEKNTQPLYNGRDNLYTENSVSEKTPETKRTSSPYARPFYISSSTTVTSVPWSTSQSFTGKEESTTDRPPLFTLSPRTQNSLSKSADHTSFPAVGKPSHPNEVENVSPSKELVSEFPQRPFSSSVANSQSEITSSRESEIPSGSTKANLYEGANSQVTSESITPQSTHQHGSATKKLGSASSNTAAMPTAPPLTTKSFTATTLLPPPTTAKTMRSFTVRPHLHSQNIPTGWGRTGLPDSPNHIPDRHQERILTTDQDIRPVIKQTPDRTKPVVSHSTGLSENMKPDTNPDTELGSRKPKPPTVKKAPTAIPNFPVVHPPRLTIPLKPGGSSSTVFQTPAVPTRRGQPKITSTDVKTVTTQAESDAYLPCAAVGEPTPFLSWTKVSTGASIAQNTKIQRFEVHSNGTLIIRKVLPLDRGQYLCRIQNQYGEDKMVVTLIILAEHPRVLQPRYRDVTTHLGNTVELECHSQGQPQPRITWMLPNRAILHIDAPSTVTPGPRDSDLAGVTHNQRISVLANGTLRITSSTYTDRGVYKCIASNAAGVDSISVRLTVAALPPVISQPRQENLTLPEGSTAYLNCSAVGAPTPTISWSTPDGITLRPTEFLNGRNLLVFPNGTLYIRGLGQTDAGKYECTATSMVGTSSRALRLTVKKSIASARARITSSSPQKTDVVYGGKLQLDCIASGDPEPRVIWKTPSKKLVDAHYSYDPRIKVFANGSLFIHSVTEKDEGDYLCAARNKAGDDYVPLKVVVLTKPAKIEQKSQTNQKVMYGGDLKVDCVASGLPNPKIQWALPDGTMINSIIKSESGNAGRRRYVVFDNGTLFFNDVGMHEEGDYTCYAENKIGKDEMKVHVKVLADVPVIRNKSNDVVRVMYGDRASLTCFAKGEPNPQILWFSPTNRAIPPASSKYFIHNDGTLVIQNVQRFDGGNYTCLARNSAGQDRKVTRLEILVSPPAINGLRGSTNSLKVSAMRDQRKMIHCEATGTPVPHVIWVLPENVILPTPYYGSQMTVHRNGSLDIHSLKVTDAGKLTCIARNEGGEARLVVQLDLIDVIEKPRLRSPKTESLSITIGRTMMLNCSVEGSPTPQLTWVLPGGAPLMTGSQFAKFYHKPDGTLLINNPAMSEAGTYRCLGRNAGGLVDRTVVLTPGRKPEINNKYNSPVSVINGESLQLHCVSTSDPIRLTWTLPSGVVLNRPQRAGRYAVLPNGTLSIQQASVYDRGSYTCRAANEYGSSLLTISVAIITYSPRITSGPASTTYARRGVAVQLNCAATGIPKPEVAWETPDRSRLIVSPQPRLFGNKYLHPQGFLIIQNPMPKDTGFYRCTARNVIGVDSKGTYLHVY